MQRQTTVNLGNLVLSLSDAMDLASPLLIQHQQRTALVSWKMGRKAGLSEERLRNGFLAALLHDIGAFSLDEKIAIHKSEAENPDQHCLRGALLLTSVPWLSGAAQIVRNHHRGWKEWEEPIGDPVVLDSQLLLLADSLERMIDRDRYILHQQEHIVADIESMSGQSLHADVVDLFVQVAKSEEFWFDLVSHRIYSLLLHDGPLRRIEIDISNISLIAELFRNIIDFRSRFTSTHSSGVALAASMLAKIFGLTQVEVGLMEVAGNLHDIGKLAIPSSILNKPGNLTKEEMAVMKSHTYHTYSIIDTIGGLQQIAEWAAYHHERLDGSGYPFHCTENELNLGARIMMVADMLTALIEDRPYRKGMSKDESIKIIKQFADRNLLDSRVVEILMDNYDEIVTAVTARQKAVKSFYEEQFSFLD